MRPIISKKIYKLLTKVPATTLATASLAITSIAANAQTPTTTRASTQKNETRTPTDTLVLGSVLVTASVSDATKMQQSLSSSTLNAQQIIDTTPTNAAEVLRAIPGVRSESSGGEGNANITVRGLPISAGGARYVQIQEDGLPLLQFGDIAFATADQFLRVDGGLDHLEVVRGGSASTLASNTPGGVINFISQTGKNVGGGFGISKGIDFSQTRYDLNYGQPLQHSDSRYFISGIYRTGESTRDAGIIVEKGSQLKGNITKALGNGYVRIYVKHLDDSVPMAMPVPVNTSNGRISPISGIDPRTASFYSPYWIADPTIDKNNNGVFSNVNDGLQVQSSSLGLEAEFELANGFSITEKFRIASNSGRFIAVFPADNGYFAGPFSLATGPYTGQAYSGGVFTATVFNVSLDDLGNTINDINIKKNVILSEESDLNVVAGFYESIQQVGLTWNFNQYLMTIDGSKPALVSNAATSDSIPGLIAWGTDVWGGCCSRNIDSEYATSSPYINLELFTGPWHFDAGVRRDHQAATGRFLLATEQNLDVSSTQFIDYEINKTSTSLGVNYLLNDDLALFLRGSEGYGFNADRIMFNDFALDGTVKIPTNKVNQIEGGAKWRHDNISTFITYFNADTEETNYEATTQTFTQRKYDAQGIELEAAYASGNLRINVGATVTDAEIDQAESSQLNGNQPRRQAKWLYQVVPSYAVGNIRFGTAVIGSTDAWGNDENTIKMQGYTVVNAFVNYHLDERSTLSLSANNLTNKLAYTEVEADGHAARALSGRSVIAGFRYSL